MYKTTARYNMMSSEDTSSGRKVSFFASDLCVTDGTDIGTDQTASQVAEASGVFNLDTGAVTYSQNIYEQIYPASTTKILTAYVALKYGDLSQQITVSENAVNQASDSSVCGLNAGDVMTLEQLLYGMMLKSGNDAAVAIAEGISGDIDSFAELMNQTAAEIGATHTHFVNPNGLHDSNHYTTVYDMYLMFQAALSNSSFEKIVTSSEYTVNYTNSLGEAQTMDWTTTNRYLLGSETVPSGVTILGGKTGTTNPAGYCLVLYSQNELNQKIVSIVMKADCRRNLYYY
ncbi:MAG: serine hydrolase, partial [Lachnospiraceae bacterium]|nr:serine hydrolase [Lachnospiraceae bacterium]